VAPKRAAAPPGRCAAPAAAGRTLGAPKRRPLGLENGFFKGNEKKSCYPQTNIFFK